MWSFLKDGIKRFEVLVNYFLIRCQNNPVIIVVNVRVILHGKGHSVGTQDELVRLTTVRDVDAGKVQ